MGNCFAGVQMQATQLSPKQLSPKQKQPLENGASNVEASLPEVACVKEPEMFPTIQPQAIQTSDAYDIDELRAEAKLTLQKASASGNLMKTLAEILPEIVAPPATTLTATTLTATSPPETEEVDNHSVEESVTVMEKETVIEELQKEEDFLRHLLQGPDEKHEDSVDIEAPSGEAKCTWQSLRDEVSFHIGELVEFEYDEEWKKGIVTSTIPLKVRYVILHDDEGLEYDNVRKIAQASTVDEHRIVKKQEDAESKEAGMLDLRLKAKHALLCGAESGRLELALAETSEVEKTLGSSDGNQERLETSVDSQVQADINLSRLVKQTLLDGMASGKLEEALRKRRGVVRLQDIEGFEDTPLDRMDLEELRQGKYAIFDSYDSGRLTTALDKVKSNYLVKPPVSPSRGGS